MSNVVVTQARTGARRSLTWASLLILLLAGGCASSKGPEPVPAPGPRQIGKVVSHPASTPEQELIALLRKVEDQGSPLLALDAETKGALDRILARLSANEREQVASNMNFARARPLLHLAASGVAPVAYEALAANGVAAEELVRGRIEGGLTAFADLGPVVRGVVSRAARRVLRDCLAALDGGGELDGRMLTRIVANSEALEQNDLATRALELLLKAHPDSIYGYELVRLYAEAGKSEVARATLTQLTGKGGQARALASRSEVLVSAAELLRAAPRSDLDLEAALKLARAELLLARFDQALQTLLPFENRVDTHLGLAAAWAEASLRGTLCPGVPRGNGVVELCAASWQKDPIVERIQTRLGQAWSSGNGRDPGSIEAYLALHYVVPLLYGSSSQSTPSATPAAASPNGLEALERELASVRDVSTRFAALQLFTRVLRGSAQADARAPKRLSTKEVSAWIAEAGALMKTAKDDRVAQTTALGVATSLLQERDVTPILTQVDPDTLADGNLLALWIKLAALSAVMNQNLELLEHAKGALAGWLGQSVSTELEHTQLILLLAECDAALHPNDTPKWKALSLLGSQLAKLASNELGDEARIVEAVGLAHTEHREAAINVLGELLNAEDNGAPTANTLKPVAAGFRLGLQTLAASGSNRTALEADLKQLIVAAQSEPQPSPNTAIWLELWQRSLRSPQAKCDLGKCSAKVFAKAPELERKLGPQVARLLKRGLLPLGGAGLSLDYSFFDGLRPLVQLEPQLFAVGP